MILALFGDVHGNLAGLYGLCQQWEQEADQKIDLVLQTGDMGLWRYEDSLDKATRKHLKHDRTELAGIAYLSGQLLAPIETWFVHGNHEDFRLLREPGGNSLDPAGKIHFLAPGTVQDFCKNEDRVRVAALGGMEYRFGKHLPPEEGAVQKYLHAPSLERLRKEHPKVDILLLHDAPLNRGLKDTFPTGSRRITELIEHLQPRFAFYGHYRDPPAPFRIRSTVCACLNLPQARRIPGRDGSMGILRTGQWVFKFVAP
jgi:Icc-related predicted phosphoesterase